MERLTSIDAGFLAQERAGSHMHIGSVTLFEGRAPAREAFLQHLASRLHLDLEDLGTLFEEAIDELRDAAFSAEASLRA